MSASLPASGTGRGRPSTERPRKTIGFGFDPESSPHHFAVVRERRGAVTVVERFAWGDSADQDSVSDSPKVTLSEYLWERIAPAAAAEFNRRLKDDGLRAGTWGKGETVLAPHLGKELALLAWAVENQDSDPTPIPSMIANWSGLAPEERWWFYTTINATSAHHEHGRDRGWRRAIKVAFAENPVQLPSSALLIGPMPSSTTRGRGKPKSHKDDAAAQGRLWGEGDST